MTMPAVFHPVWLEAVTCQCAWLALSHMAVNSFSVKQDDIYQHAAEQKHLTVRRK